MARKRHSPDSIAAVLRRVEAGVPIAELARKAGVHENTIHLWRARRSPRPRGLATLNAQRSPRTPGVARR